VIVMTDFYRGFSHPVITELVPDIPHNLFAQMDFVADEIRKNNPQHVHDDDKIAFRQLQKMLWPEMSHEDFCETYCLWCEHYAGKQFADDDAQAVRYAALVRSRDFLLRARERFPERHTELTARLYVIGCELAEFQPRAQDGDGGGQWPGSA
jgi:hypothetical protein